MMLLPAKTRLHPDEYVSYPIIADIAIVPTPDYDVSVCRNVKGKIHECILTDNVVYVRNGRQRDRVERRLMRFKARNRKSHTNTPILLPAPRVAALLPAVAISAHPVQLTLLPAPGNDLPVPPGYYPKEIA